MNPTGVPLSGDKPHNDELLAGLWAAGDDDKWVQLLQVALGGGCRGRVTGGRGGGDHAVAAARAVLAWSIVMMWDVRPVRSRVGGGRAAKVVFAPAVLLPKLVIDAVVG